MQKRLYPLFHARNTILMQKRLYPLFSCRKDCTHFFTLKRETVNSSHGEVVTRWSRHTVKNCDEFTVTVWRVHRITLTSSTSPCDDHCDEITVRHVARCDEITVTRSLFEMWRHQRVTSSLEECDEITVTRSLSPCDDFTMWRVHW